MKKATFTAVTRAASLSPIRLAAKPPVVFRLAAKINQPTKISVCLVRSLIRRPWGVRQISPLALFWRGKAPKQCGWNGITLSAPLFVRPCRRVIPVRGFAQSQRSQPVTIHFANNP